LIASRSYLYSVFLCLIQRRNFRLRMTQQHHESTEEFIGIACTIIRFTDIGIRRGVSKGVEDGRKAVSEMARPQGAEA
jgi:hypothetical protein